MEGNRFNTEKEEVFTKNWVAHSFIMELGKSESAII